MIAHLVSVSFLIFVCYYHVVFKIGFSIYFVFFARNGYTYSEFKCRDISEDQSLVSVR